MSNLSKLEKMKKPKEERKNDPMQKKRREDAMNSSFHPNVIKKWPREKFFADDSPLKLTFN